MPATSPRKRRPLAELSNVTFGDFLEHPDMLVGPADLASAGIAGSYSTQTRWVKTGKLRPPVSTPSGRNNWLARHVLEDTGLDHFLPDRGHEQSPSETVTGTEPDPEPAAQMSAPGASATA